MQPWKNIFLFDNIFILGIGLELACNGGLCGEISLNREIFFSIKKDKCYFHLKILPALASVASQC